MFAITMYLTHNFLFTGFVSIDCGGTNNFTDDLGLDWVSDNQFIYGTGFNISVPSEKRKQYTTLRCFPADNRKYCYRFSVKPRTRYLVRASFLYGNFDNSNVYPKFDIYLGATHWSTIVISDADTIEVKELILLAYTPTISVCLSNATTGQPFISTLELRQFNGSVYYTDYETQFFLSLSARIDFGSVSDDPVRYLTVLFVRANFMTMVCVTDSMTERLICFLPKIKTCTQKNPLIKLNSNIYFFINIYVIII